jgi:hypothetical protein
MLELRDLHFAVDRGEGSEGGGKRGIINGINFNFEKGNSMPSPAPTVAARRPWQN